MLRQRTLLLADSLEVHKKSYRTRLRSPRVNTIVYAETIGNLLNLIIQDQPQSVESTMHVIRNKMRARAVSTQESVGQAA